MPIQVPQHIRDLVPYVPGKPIEETQREFKIKRVIKLASNENPLGPSPKAMKAIRAAVGNLQLYPDASAYNLKQRLAKFLKRDASEIVVGNGSDDLINVLVRSYCNQGDGMVTSVAAFVAYKVCAQTQGVQTFAAPMTFDLRFDLVAMAKLVKEHSNVRIVFIANPNNPTGTYVNETELRKFLTEVQQVRGGSVLVVIDSAYTEFVTAKDLPNALKLQGEFSNVVVLRTFSKAYGLGGLRVGYGIAQPELIATLNKVRQPFNVNSLGLVGASAALDDQVFVRRSKKNNIQGMKFWEKSLRDLGIPFWPSQGNFLLVDVASGMGLSGIDVYNHCLKKGVIFRPVANYGLHHALRISVGTMEENRFAMNVLKKLKAEKVPELAEKVLKTQAAAREESVTRAR